MRTVPPTEKGKYRAIASGAIANGKPVVVNSDGTVGSAVSDTPSAGTEVTFEAGSIDAGDQSLSSTFDSNTNRVVFAYRDSGNSDYGTAIVGTVSGSSISFGTPIVYESAEITYPVCTFDSNSNKVVIAYTDNTPSPNDGNAIVGTVDPSDNSISFGSPTVFDSATVGYLSMTFDSNSNKVVIVYQDNGNGNYGTAIVGTVSGTSISFGSEAVFESAITIHTNPASTVFDSNSNKVVILYNDNGNSNYGTAVVGTVSGTSISFGSPVVFQSSYTHYPGAAFDSDNNKVVIFYWDQGASIFKAIIGTVSGTSISFGTATSTGLTNGVWPGVVYNTNTDKVNVFYRKYTSPNEGVFHSGTVSGTSISFDSVVTITSDAVFSNTAVFDSNSNRTVVGYRDGGDSSKGKSAVISPTTSNLTTENYIGIANSCSFHGNTETITVTVAGGIFYLDGVANPVIQLLKGHTYIFDQADGTNDGHPLHFKDSGGSQYTTGVTVTGTAGTSGAKVTIAIASDATEPTRYYCTVHGNGMGNTINLSDSFVNVDVIGTVNDQQSSLTAGQQYFVQTDGTLSETADSPSVFAGTAISATELVVKE
tara:strand:+ start:218 stop:1993 length:1776 start_codon:yes stop_codon:yes gene_type:complete